MKGSTKLARTALANCPSSSSTIGNIWERPKSESYTRISVPVTWNSMIASGQGAYCKRCACRRLKISSFLSLELTLLKSPERRLNETLFCSLGHNNMLTATVMERPSTGSITTSDTSAVRGSDAWSEKMRRHQLGLGRKPLPGPVDSASSPDCHCRSHRASSSETCLSRHHAQGQHSVACQEDEC